MRPPEHWHLRPRRSSKRPWLAAGAIVGVILAVVLGVRMWAGGEGGAAGPPVSQVADATVCSDTSGCQQGRHTYVGSVPPPKITGRAAAVVEQPCGALLYGRNEHTHFAPASLTKIATALVAADRARLNDEVTVDINSGLLAESTNSTVMGLEPGMRLSMRDLLYGLLLVSGNDAALAIANQVGGTEQGFVAMMNAKASQLGLHDTHFANPHGLDNPAHFSSASDMATLGSALLANANLAAIVRTKRYQPAWDGPELWNGNELINTYPGLIGVKIGYTEKAGQTIVAAAQRNGRTIVVAVMSAWDRYSDAAGLLDWAFDSAPPSCTESATSP